MHEKNREKVNTKGIQKFFYKTNSYVGISLIVFGISAKCF